ncbi:MAG: hypothetical protein J6Q05_00935 [Elusimicrobiaceae bacterium]|nr:hypothetical protein [Elusimicrobiaceae bacterium]
MKIPYIKLYTADLLAASRNLTAQQIGEAVLGLCETAFENDTLYAPQTAREEAFFNMLLRWKDESKTAWQQRKKAGRNGGKHTQQKNKKIDGSEIISSALSNPNKHTDTETEAYTETETENISLIVPLSEGQKEKEISLGEKEIPLPAEFVDQVLARFEHSVQTPRQRHIFVKNNASNLKDILEFCDHNIPLALQTISVCARRLQQGGVTGGYAAVCRNLPEYYDKAKKELAEVPYD